MLDNNGYVMFHPQMRLIVRNLLVSYLNDEKDAYLYFAKFKLHFKHTNIIFDELCLWTKSLN